MAAMRGQPVKRIDGESGDSDDDSDESTSGSEDDEVEGWVWRGWELRERFERYDKLDDIQKSIALLFLANDNTPITHLEKPARLEQLGISVRARFLRLG